MKTVSWVIVNKASGEAVLETYSERVKNAVNTKAYSVVPILEYLRSLNKKSL